MEKCVEKNPLDKTDKNKNKQKQKANKTQTKKKTKEQCNKNKTTPLVLPTVGTVPELVGCIEVVVEVVDDAADGLRSTVVTVGNGTA